MCKVVVFYYDTDPGKIQNATLIGLSHDSAVITWKKPVSFNREYHTIRVLVFKGENTTLPEKQSFTYGFGKRHILRFSVWTKTYS